MFLLISADQDTDFYIVDRDEQIIRKSMCKNCNVMGIVRMARNIITTYPKIEEVKVLDISIGSAVVESLSEVDWMEVPVSKYTLRVL